jgi:hypothetical protein
MQDRSAAIRAAIEAATQGLANAEVVYRSEWLGHLPYGAYCWLECQGEDLSHAMPHGWSVADVELLQGTHFLREISREQDQTDEFQLSIKYAVASSR